MYKHNSENYQKYKEKRDGLLEMGHRKATNILDRMIMLNMAQKLGKDVCFRCGNKIENLKDFSVEHKIPWLDAENPKETFFDLDNIAFSHLSCNKSAGRRHPGKSGIKGIHYRPEWHPKKPYSVVIWDGEKNKFMGNFETLDEAHNVYDIIKNNK
jgi:5-methylcytosine-specific restriction endonuclease McrA